jgi:hypothetical protein
VAEINLKRLELIHELKHGSIAAIEGNELRISFIFKNGVDDGFMVDGSCAIKHFSSDEKAQTELEKIKQKAV